MAVYDTSHNNKLNSLYHISNLIKNRWDWLVLFFVAVWTFYVSISYVNANNAILLDKVTVDDSFYYFGVAKNVVASHGFTFDGINPTNGFQVLWMFLILPIFALITDPFSQIRAVVLLSSFLNLFAATMLFIILKKLTGSIPALIGTTVFLINPTLLKISISGMETSLNSSIILLFLYYLLFSKKMNFDKWSNVLILGAMIGILMLSRIENALLGPIIALYILFRIYTKEEPLIILKNMGILFTGFLLTGGPYLLLNYLFFRAFTPVNGNTKLFYEKSWLLNNTTLRDILVNAFKNVIIFGQYTFHLTFGRFAQYLDSSLFNSLGIVIPWRNIMLLMIVAMMLSFVYLILLSCKREYKDYSPGITIFSTFAIIHFLFVSMILPHFLMYTTWYLSTEFIFLILLLSFLIMKSYNLFLAWTGKMWSYRIKTLTTVLITVFLVLSANAINDDRKYELAHVPDKDRSTVLSFYYATQWMNDNLPQGSRIGSFSAGIVGFFSNHNVVNLDGLINNQEYLHYMEMGQFEQYIDNKNIKYIADYFTYDPTIEGVNWFGHIPPERVSVVKKWPLPENKTYYVLQIKSKA